MQGNWSRRFLPLPSTQCLFRHWTRNIYFGLPINYTDEAHVNNLCTVLRDYLSMWIDYNRKCLAALLLRATTVPVSQPTLLSSTNPSDKAPIYLRRRLPLLPPSDIKFVQEVVDNFHTVLESSNPLRWLFQQAGIPSGQGFSVKSITSSSTLQTILMPSWSCPL